jgi:plastocyanin
MGLERRDVLAGLTVLGLPALSSIATAKPKIVKVSMGEEKMVFLPVVVRIAAGDTVSWTNPGVISHTVTFDPSASKSTGGVELPPAVKPFGSGDLEQGDSFSHQFDVKGTYKYICKYHQQMGMVGTVIVV